VVDGLFARVHFGFLYSIVHCWKSLTWGLAWGNLEKERAGQGNLFPRGDKREGNGWVKVGNLVLSPGFRSLPLYRADCRCVWLHLWLDDGLGPLLPASLSIIQDFFFPIISLFLSLLLVTPLTSANTAFIENGRLSDEVHCIHTYGIGLGLLCLLAYIRGGCCPSRSRVGLTGADLGIYSSFTGICSYGKKHRLRMMNRTTEWLCYPICWASTASTVIADL
jgi:hypothetical protein